MPVPIAPIDMADIDSIMRRARPIDREAMKRSAKKREAQAEARLRLARLNDPSQPPHGAPQAGGGAGGGGGGGGKVEPAGAMMTPDLVRLSDLTPRSVEWLWPGRLPLGKISVIAGDPGLGKSFLTADMAAVVSKGAAWPDNRGQSITPGDCLILSAEDDPEDTILLRVKASGGDLARVAVMRGVRDSFVKQTLPFRLDTDVRMLRAALQGMTTPRLVVIDPISAYLGKADANSNSEVRAVLSPLADLAAEFNVAVVCVTHLNKSGQGQGMYRIMGSLGLIAAARAGWMVVRDANNPEHRYLANVKMNIARPAPTLGFFVRERVATDTASACVHWDPRPFDASVNDLLHAEEHSAEEPGAVDEAREFLRQFLATGARPVNEVTQEAEQMGISARTLSRARKRMNILATRTREGWLLALP